MNKYKAIVTCESYAVTAWFDIKSDEPSAYREAMAWIGRQCLHYSPKPISASVCKVPDSNQPRHMCGLMGFNPMLGDSCEVCDILYQDRKSSSA